MASSIEGVEVYPPPMEQRYRSSVIRRAIWNFARSQPLGVLGACILLTLAFAALFGAQLVPYDPLKANASVRLQGPSLHHLFGTDNLGRDMFSRIVWAAKPSFFTGIIVVSFTAVFGMSLGVISAYFGGLFDLLFQRVIDAMQVFPGLVFAMAVVTAMGNKMAWGIPWSVVVALSVILLPGTSRVIRAAALGVKQNAYIEAARMVGASRLRIVFRHIVPNVMAPVIVVASVQLGGVILAESALSFLGLGVAPPTPSWGGMLSGNGLRFMEAAPWLAIFPGLAISLAVLAFNLLGDAIQDTLDPRLRRAGRARF